MQPARDAHVLDLLVWEAELVGDRGSQVGDSSRVPAHVRVLRFEGVHQRFERGDGNALELLALAVQLGRAGRDLFLEPLVELPVLRSEERRVGKGCRSRWAADE